MCRDQSDPKRLSCGSEKQAHGPWCLQLCRLVMSSPYFPASFRGLRPLLSGNHQALTSLLHSPVPDFWWLFFSQGTPPSLLSFASPKPVFSGPSSSLPMHLPNPPPHLISSFCFTPVNRMSLVHFGTKAEQSSQYLTSLSDLPKKMKLLAGAPMAPSANLPHMGQSLGT